MGDCPEVIRVFTREDSAIVVTLSERDRVLISQIPKLLATVQPDAQDRGFEVLHRDAYRDDSAASHEFAELTAADTESMRNADRRVVASVGEGRSQLSRDEAVALLRSMNEARLVMAARSGAFDEGPDWEDRIEVDPTLAAVAWLGYVQGELITALRIDV